MPRKVVHANGLSGRTNVAGDATDAAHRPSVLDGHGPRIDRRRGPLLPGPLAVRLAREPRSRRRARELDCRGLLRVPRVTFLSFGGDEATAAALHAHRP